LLSLIKVPSAGNAHLLLGNTAEDLSDTSNTVFEIEPSLVFFLTVLFLPAAGQQDSKLIIVIFSFNVW
jgi:hypothetical protein